MLALMLIDAVDPRYGGSPDPDDERRRRWQPMDRRVTVPFLASASCLIVSAVTSPEASAGLTVAAVGLCAYAARAALAPRKRATGPDEPADPLQ
jgi:hypothetical protein